MSVLKLQDKQDSRDLALLIGEELYTEKDPQKWWDLVQTLSLEGKIFAVNNLLKLAYGQELLEKVTTHLPFFEWVKENNYCWDTRGIPVPDRPVATISDEEKPVQAVLILEAYVHPDGDVWVKTSPDISTENDNNVWISSKFPAPTAQSIVKLRETDEPVFRHVGSYFEVVP